jgi:hypothetical protein
MGDPPPFVYLRLTSNDEVPKNVTHVQIDPSVQQIEREAFFRRRRLLAVEFSEGLEVIGYDSFSNCRLLKTAVLPSTIIDVRDDAFAHGRNLTKVWLPQGLQWIGERTFADCTALKTIQIPSTVQELQFRLFVNCRNLLSVELSEGLKVISEKAFEHCTSLKNLVIPSTVEVVEENAFTDCMKLQQRFPYTEDLLNALRQRFEGLPIHEFCYSQAFQETTTTMEDFNSMADNASTSKTVDNFGMTPIHILALSTKPNLRLMRALLQEYTTFSVLANMKDRWGNAPFDYLFLNNTWTESKKSMDCLIRVTILNRANGLGLPRWEQDISTGVETFLNEYDSNGESPSRSSEKIKEIFATLTTYERLEVTSLLELALWKVKLHDTEATGLCGVKAAESSTFNRQNCRINCGIEIVISNVLPFLWEKNDWLT